MIKELLNEISKLPGGWHRAGSVSMRVLEAMARNAGPHPISHSAETGSGKTTLLFSRLSQDHKVFAMEGDNDSITVVRNSPLFHSAAVEFIEGPTQITLPQYKFRNRLQIAMIDGPHGYPFPEMEYLCFYPQLDEGGLLIVDDIHIPTIRNLFNFLCDDEMFHLLEVVDQAAFFRRTAAPIFDPLGDGWWIQGFNKKRFRAPRPPLAKRLRNGLASRVPGPLKSWLKRRLQ